MNILLLGVFSSREKAVSKVKELYDEDIEWLTTTHNFDLNELDDNTYEEGYSNVSYDEYFSENSIKEQELQ